MDLDTMSMTTEGDRVVLPRVASRRGVYDDVQRVRVLHGARLEPPASPVAAHTAHTGESHEASRPGR